MQKTNIWTKDKKKKKGQLFKIHTQKKKTLQEENQQLDLKNK